MILDSKAPTGPIEQAWEQARFAVKLVNPANKRKHSIIVIGSGLAGASASATLGELGYKVHCFCFQDSPRRAHSTLRRAALTPPRIIKTTATASTASSTTPSKAEISAHARPTSIAWRKTAST